jgi:hypothetical protein
MLYFYVYCYARYMPFWFFIPSQITELARNKPGLMTLKNVDLSPASWMAIAW